MSRARWQSLVLISFLAFFAVGTAGCGGSREEGGDHSSTHSGAKATDFPQLYSLGGRTIPNPSFKTITFGSDPFAPSLELFAEKFAASAAWTEMTEEYGIHRAAAATPVRLTEAAPATTTQ